MPPPTGRVHSHEEQRSGCGRREAEDREREALQRAEDLAEQYGGDQVRPAAVTRSLVEFASSSFQSTGY